MGKELLPFIPYLKLYQDYLNVYEEMNSTMRVLRSKKNSAFVKYLCTQERTDNFTLESYLIEPVQRLPRYQLLLHEIVKHTEESHEDFCNLQQCLSEIGKLNAINNLKITEFEQRHKVFLIENRIINIDINATYSSSRTLLSSWFSRSYECKYPKFRLVSPSRRFLKQGYLTKVSRKKNIRYLFILFNDLLLYASDATLNDNLIMHERINLDDPDFRVKRVRKESVYHSYNAFEIHSIEKSFICYAATFDETGKWYDAINLCVEELVSKKWTGVAEVDTVPESVDGVSDGVRILETAPLWSPKEAVTRCMVIACKKEFGMLFNRMKYNCGYCGHVVCGECCKQSLLHYDPEKRKQNEKVQVCTECYRKYSIRVRRVSRSESLLNLDALKGADGGDDDDDDVKRSAVELEEEEVEDGDEEEMLESLVMWQVVCVFGVLFEGNTEWFVHVLVDVQFTGLNCMKKLLELGYENHIALQACELYSNVADAVEYINLNLVDAEKKLSMRHIDELISKKYKAVDFEIFVAIDFGTHGMFLFFVWR